MGSVAVTRQIPLFALPALLGWATVGHGQTPEKAPAALPVADQLFAPIRKIDMPVPLGLPAAPTARADTLADIVGRMEEADTAGLDSAEAAALARRLRSLVRKLEECQPMRISRLALAKSVDDRGQSEPWPAGHMFRPGRGDEPGDRMLVLVEVENLRFSSKDGRDECAFAVRTELRDRASIRQQMTFPAKAVRKPDDSGRQWLTLCFHLPPRLNPGQHTLAVEVEQADGKLAIRTRKTVEFLVGIGRDDAPSGQFQGPKTGIGGSTE